MGSAESKERRVLKSLSVFVRVLSPQKQDALAEKLLQPENLKVTFRDLRSNDSADVISEKWTGHLHYIGNAFFFLVILSNLKSSSALVPLGRRLVALRDKTRSYSRWSLMPFV